MSEAPSGQMLQVTHRNGAVGIPNPSNSLMTSSPFPTPIFFNG
jgi:hypothetical protein